jgi:chaperone required for assembly of F1-ATPase
MKRFYKQASHGAAEQGGFAILLDGKTMRTPNGHTLAAPYEGLAAAVAAEWGAQENEVRPNDMVLTQILTTALELTPEARKDISRRTLAYLDTDLLCYRAITPPELAKQQAEKWDPQLAWFEGKFGAALKTTGGIAALTQPIRAHDAAAQFVEGLDDLHFTLLQTLTALTGSLVLAMAFVAGDADAEMLYRAMHVEEDYKAKLYNEEEHGAAPMQEKRQKNVRRELEESARFLSLLSP